VEDPNTADASTGDVTATRYYTFAGSTVAVRTDDGQLALMLGDEQGSTNVMMPVQVEANGTLSPATIADAEAVTRTSYTPYGQLRGADNLTTDRGWLGQVEDRISSDGASGTGLTYLNARYYDPALGRFLSPDPLMNPGDPRTLDAYRYADNNPVVFTDASGLCSTTGNWAYVGSVLEPPCTKSNGDRYTEKALAPDPLHGDTGWANTGGWGKPPNDSIPDIVSFLLQEQEYLPDGTHGCTTYACMYGAPTHTGDAGAPGEREPISDAVWGFFVGDDIDGCFSGSGIAEPATGCTMLGSNFIPGVGPGKWGIKGGGKLFKWLTRIFKHGDDVLPVMKFEGKAAAREALDGAQGTAANRFFRDATAKSRDFEAQLLPDGGYQLRFFSPANNPGYGKLYVQEIDAQGVVVREFKDTMGPDGLIERKWVSGGS
jgi:RHS repeat-associated protein